MANLKKLIETLHIDDAWVSRVNIPGVKGECILELDTARGVKEVPPASPLEALSRQATPLLSDVVAGLRRGARDPKVRGLIVHAGGGLPLAEAEELRVAIVAFRTSGKPTVAWSESFLESQPGTAAYLVASACDEVWLQPSGDLMLTGAALEPTFLRQALDRLGVVPQFEGRREFKTAGETFMNDHLSDPNRKQLQAILDSTVAELRERIAHARGLDDDTMQRAFGEGILSAAEAAALGLIDRVGYRDEAFASIRARVTGNDTTSSDTAANGHDDTSASPAPEVRYVERYASAPLGGRASLPSPKRAKKHTVALITATGAIHTGRATSTPLGGHSIGSDDLGAALRRATEDEVEAVLLRVDSRGGSAVASDAIRREVIRVKEAGIPVIVSMGPAAASGGYYISMAANEIVANPFTLTGSIGVIVGKMVTGHALARIGITHDAVEAGPHARTFSPNKEFDEHDWRLVNRMLDRVYDDFVDRAAHDRGMDRDRLESVARGRVWTGRDAATHGLVDHLGGLDTALDRVAIRLGVSRSSLEVKATPKKSVMERFLPTENSDAVRAPAPVWGSVDALISRVMPGAAGSLTAHLPDLR